jgi:2',3'-cyclic-nucleotide 2'-phosphodiesterase (5'-nucleotidase family)
MKPRLLFLVLIVAALAWSAGLAAEPPKAPAPDAPETVAVTLLHINDTHGQTQPYLEGSKIVGGYARLATLIGDLRGATASTSARTFLIHAGDEFSRADELTNATHGAANIAIWNYLKFDIWTPGNGDYYDDLPVVLKRFHDFKGTVLAANVQVKATGEPVGKPYVLSKAGPVRIAFFGLCWLQPFDESFGRYKVEDQYEAARRLVPELRKQADVVVAVTHMGDWPDKRLAEMVDGIDVIIGAHFHTLLPKGMRVTTPSGGHVLICQVGAYMQYFGRVDLRLAKAGNGYRLVSAEATAIPIDESVKPDLTVAAMIARMSEEAGVSAPAPAAPKKPAARADKPTAEPAVVK